MYSDTLFFLFEIFLIFSNLFYLSNSNTSLISSTEKEEFVSTKDINEPFTNIALLQSVKFSNPTTPNITSRSENLITQKLANENVILKRSPKRVVNVSKGVLNAKQKNKRQKRRAISYHPTQKMDADEIKTFRTKVSPNCKLGHRTFAVMKKTTRVGATKSSNDRFKFYAIARRNDDLTIFDELEKPLFNRKYKNQIAVISCGYGWIWQLDVFDDAKLHLMNEQGQYVVSIVNARNCGIGVVLTELCLLDSDIYAFDQHNHGKELLDNQRITLHNDCRKLVGLAMAALPPSGGHVYLSSAIRTGYPKLLVHKGCLPGLPGEEEEHEYNTYETAVARQNFDSLSGDIEPCSGNERCRAWLKNWYFCDD